MSLAHLYRRKRQSTKSLHPFPANSRGLRLLDKFVYTAGIISLLMMIPQLKLIYMAKNASGLEPMTWIVFALMDIPWIVYGLVHREPPLVFIYTMWLVANLLVFIGAVLY